jgi:AraC-like DNA-binding protein
VQVSPVLASYTHCWPTWRDIDYIPDYNKFYFICSGEGWLKIGGEEFNPVAGQFFLMPASVKQSYSAINDNPFTKYWCHFQAKVGERNLFDIIKVPYHVNIKNSEYIIGLFNELIINYRRDDLGSIFKVKSIILALISYYLDNTPSTSIRISKPNSIERLEPVLNYIDENLSMNISLEKLSGLAHFHPTHFIRYFRNQTGLPPMQYIRKLRLEKAKNYLLETESTLSEISSLLGFYDQFHFSKDFKEYTGYSPSEYKKAIITSHIK